jgi:hypothetical protein
MPHPSELLPPQDYAAMAPRALTEPHAVAALPGALSHLDVAYATMIGRRPLRLDLHVSAGSPGPHPVVVYAHGGSFVGGIPALGPWTSLPAQGIAVASVAYRLAGEVPFPEPVEDIRAAIRWVRAAPAVRSRPRAGRRLGQFRGRLPDDHGGFGGRNGAGPGIRRAPGPLPRAVRARRHRGTVLRRGSARLGGTRSGWPARARRRS